MPSAVLLNLLRVSRSAATRHALIGARSSPEATVQVGRFFAITFMNLNHTQTRLKPFVYICPEGGWGIARGGGCAVGQQVGQQRPAGRLGLVWYLGQQGRGARAAALQRPIRKTFPEGE